MTCSGHQSKDLAPMDYAVLKVPVSEAAWRWDGSGADLDQNLNTEAFVLSSVARSVDFSVESGGQQCKHQPGVLLRDAGISLAVYSCSSWQSTEWRQD